MKYFLYTIIFAGCFGFLISLLTSAAGVSLVFLAPIAVALIIIRIKDHQNLFRKKILSNALLLPVLIIVFYGCTVKVPMTPDVRDIEYNEKLPVDAGLLITENTRQYVFRGKPESFTGGARPHEFPLGQTLELASKLIFSELLQDVSLIRSLEEGQRFKLVIKPQIDDFHFRYDQLSHAGFAVSCLSRIKVTISLFGEGAKIWEKTIESPEVSRGPWMLNVEYEKDLGESAAEALVYSLNQLALEIAKDESLRAQILGQKPIVSDLPQEKQVITPSPETTPDVKATDQAQEAPKLASIPKDGRIVRVTLREQPRTIRNQIEIRRILANYNFFEINMNTQGNFANHIVDNNDGTITDKATGLMWQKSGSLERLDNRGAKKYVKQLNREGFAGYSDWRLPTVEELASLLARKRKNGVHLAPEFDNKCNRCWTADEFEPSSTYASGTWIVNFKNGQILKAIYRHPANTMNFAFTGANKTNYVKAVRTVW